MPEGPASSATVGNLKLNESTPLSPGFKNARDLFLSFVQIIVWSEERKKPFGAEMLVKEKPLGVIWTEAVISATWFGRLFCHSRSPRIVSPGKTATVLFL